MTSKTQAKFASGDIICSNGSYFMTSGIIIDYNTFPRLSYRIYWLYDSQILANSKEFVETNYGKI